MNYRDNLSVRYVGFAVGLVASTALLRRLWNTPAAKARRASAKLPPGPKREFLIGNLRNFPKDRWYDAFTRWKEEFGDIVYVDIFGTPMIILGSLEAAEELLGKRTNNYSGRPYSVMVMELMNQLWFTINQQPGPAHTEQRKIIRKAIGPQEVPHYDYVLEQEAEKLLKRLSGFKGDPRPLLVQSAGAVITIISYGQKVYDKHGEDLVETNRKRADIVTRTGKIWMVNIFPVLRHIPAWFPGATFKRVAEETAELVSKIRSFAFDIVEKDVLNGVADESVISRHINEPGISNDHLRDAMGTLYAAGFDTTSAAITNFFYTLVLYPDVQEKIQKELDEQIGGGRSPSMKEIEGLDYFNAAWNEAMRLNPPSPVGVWHVNLEADVWNGYYIPKGSTVFPLLGCMLRDPKLWGDDANEYNPNRFLLEFNPRAKELPDVLMIPFGFGNRICPGRHLAERTGLLFSAAVLSAFKIVPEDGQVYTLPFEFIDSFVMRPKDFQCTFIPRH